MNSTDKILAMRYAKAYISQDGISSAEAAKRISSLEEIYGAMMPYVKIFIHPVISADSKAEILDKITPHRGEPLNFIRIVISKGHFSIIDEIISRCHELLDEAAGIAKAEIRTPYPLPENLILRIKKLIASNPEKAEVRQIIAPELIGGFELKCGDILLDASIKGQLKRLERELEA